MREETKACLKPWNPTDSQILAAATRWGLRRRGQAGLTARHIVHDARRRDEEIALDAPEACYVVTQALEQLLFEAYFSDRREASAKIAQAAYLYRKRPSMPPSLSDRAGRVAERAVRKYGFASQWARAVDAPGGRLGE